MALQFVFQPSDVLVPQNATSATFTVSAIDPQSPSSTVTYQWRRRDTGSSTQFVNFSTDRVITLSPLQEYDNDTFTVLVSGTTTAESLTSNFVTFGIRLSADTYSEWETLTESGTNRVRRLFNLGYI